MIYFTEDALRIIKQKFFYLELTDGSKAIVYKQDQSKAQEALKKEKYKLKFSLYSMLDKVSIEKDKDVFLLGVSIKMKLLAKISKILLKEPLNIIYFEVNGSYHVLFISDEETQEDEYDCLESAESCKYDSWPCVIVKKEFGILLKSKLKSNLELAAILDKLTKI
jgi:hypothetical protein